ncbi:LysR family transcriptional regulator [Pseudomonas sp. DTU_2021_1001937_2_SI_NGA_ILE_001]|uniref:LysR family transcriptional regulator n=1 Tax=Pseudomonas sp. DTU_2021_1001937_2_SI_NGA_ILE_001 TaxID=3077589 RepID=UPI0028FC0FCF|nr:LysR family transcriptional regulator [Pseudomonas sp. DTU_2021_1001937_2_SI_NGA_ILE_001]WNW12908.1 LysR family transcriptional regulator [Pseudomonas sp. DTU_2021_1001937_2_SI_NGA_ILE_001]
MNWDDARIFLALCREHTLRGAARVLGVDQATVGRRLTSLERALGATLFLRIAGGYSLTPAGEAAQDTALAMENAAAELQRRILGMDQRMSGVVRLTTTDSLAIDFIIPALARLHAEHPGIQVQLQTSPQMLDLTRREADIAVRTLKPQNPDLVVRRLARWPRSLFASASYLQARGVPEPGSAFAGHDLVVYQPYLDSGQPVTLGGEPITHGRIAMTCSSGLMIRRALNEGIGLGELPAPLACSAGLQPVWPQREALDYDVWLVTHQDLRHTARVKVVIDTLAAAFADQR